MVGVSYHELTVGAKTERHSAGERKQFLVICVVGVAILMNSFVNAGLFEPVDIKNDGIYPGGEYIHKYLEHKDYASTGGMFRKLREDLHSTEDKDDSIYDGDMFAVYVDILGPSAGVGRFFSGILIDESKAALKQKLLEENMKKKDKDAPSVDKLQYEIGDLPSVRCAVVKFPSTDGFVSALLHNYKVFPALYAYAKKNLPEGHKFIISTTCNREKQMCTHYVPMIEQEKFLMGHPDTKDYEGHAQDQVNVDLKLLVKDIKKVVTLGYWV
eukprot:scaffold1340_cov277-Chaetoceros_neogracile.AAC.25